MQPKDTGVNTMANFTLAPNNALVCVCANACIYISNRNSQGVCVCVSGASKFIWEVSVCMCFVTMLWAVGDLRPHALPLLLHSWEHGYQMISSSVACPLDTDGFLLDSLPAEVCRQRTPTKKMVFLLEYILRNDSVGAVKHDTYELQWNAVKGKLKSDTDSQKINGRYCSMHMNSFLPTHCRLCSWSIKLMPGRSHTA